MKKLFTKILIDVFLIIIAIFSFRESSFIFCGIGIIYLGIILYRYYNKK